MIQNNYPEEVQSLLISVRDCLTEDGFFEEIGVGLEHCHTAFEAVAGPVFLKQWIEDGCIDVDADVLFDLMKKTVVEACIISLKNKGIIDSIEDGKKEIFFLTTKGRQLSESK